MRIRGIRHSSSTTYLPLPGTGFCLDCTLPINNGTEMPGKCLVIDFETDSFVGTAMLRIKNARAAFSDDDWKKPNHLDDPSNYFHRKKRTFQAIVRGRFQTPGIPMSECITGQTFRRPPGRLPPEFITNGAISIVRRLAPRLQVRLRGGGPRLWSPLLGTAQTVLALRDSDRGPCTTCDDDIREPRPSDPSSLVRGRVVHAPGLGRRRRSDETPETGVRPAVRPRDQSSRVRHEFGVRLRVLSAPRFVRRVRLGFREARGEASIGPDAGWTAAAIHGGASGETLRR